MSNLPTLTISMLPSLKGDSYFCMEITSSEKSAVDAEDIEMPHWLEVLPKIQEIFNIRQRFDTPSQQDALKCSYDELEKLKKLKLLNASGMIMGDVQTVLGNAVGFVLQQHKHFENRLLRFYVLAEKQGGGNIIFKFDPQMLKLAALPWELAYYHSEPLLLQKGGERPLGCVRVICNHLQPSLGSVSLAPPLMALGTSIESDRLRVLIAVSHANMAPDDVIIEQVAHRNAQVLLRKKLVGITVEFESLEQVKMGDLEETLSKGAPSNLLEYYGHGHNENEHATLRMGSANRGFESIPAIRLKSLKNLPPVIVFHACNSAQLTLAKMCDSSATPDSLATSLIGAGVQAVIAMQFEIRMRDVTEHIIPTFYEGLANEYSLPQIVAEIRRKLHAEAGSKVSWYVPVLYMREYNEQPYLQRLPTSLPPNPFTRGVIKNPETFEFIECAKQVQEMWKSLQSGNNLAIIGPSGSGKTAMLAFITQKSSKKLGAEVEVINLRVESEWRKTDEVKQELAQMLGGRKTQFAQLLQGRHIVLLVDNIDRLPHTSSIPSWLRGLSESRSNEIVQLVVTSTRPLNTVFSSPTQPLHKAIDTTIKLQPFSRKDAEEFIVIRLRDTGLAFELFEDVLDDSQSENASLSRMLPGNLEEACKDLYNKCSENLTKRIRILYT